MGGAQHLVAEGGQRYLEEGATKAVRVLRAGLDQKDTRRRIFAEARAHHRTSRPRADDDEVKVLLLWRRRCAQPRPPLDKEREDGANDAAEHDEDDADYESDKHVS